MKLVLIRFLAVFFFLLLTMLTGSSAFAQKENFGSFYVGPSKSQMRLRQMKWQWTIDQALAAAWPFRRENSVCVMVRGGRVYLLGDAAYIAGIHDLPVKPGDCFHRYSEADVKAWDFPIVQEPNAIRILKEEAEKNRNKQEALSPATMEAVRIDTERNEIIGNIKAVLRGF
jgi:hypothetical protein